jgi:hypothetical protein
MAQSGFTPIILFNSTTASNVPTTSNLAVGELAINIPDGKLYYNKSGTITVIATTTTAALTLPISATNGGTSQSTYTTGDTLYASASNTLSKLPIGSTSQVLTVVSGVPAWATPASGVSLSANNTWTGTQTFNGTSSIFATTLLDANETVNVVASAPSATTNFYIQSGGVQYYTSNAANNWTLNIAFSSGTSLNTALSTGQAVTFTLVTTQSTTAYYNSAVTIDGTSVTPKWIGGAPTAGNASGLDVYRGSIIKTASATYTVIMSLTQFK